MFEFFDLSNTCAYQALKKHAVLAPAKRLVSALCTVFASFNLHVLRNGMYCSCYCCHGCCSCCYPPNYVIVARLASRLLCRLFPPSVVSVSRPSRMLLSMHAILPLCSVSSALSSLVHSSFFRLSGTEVGPKTFPLVLGRFTTSSKIV